MYPVLPMCHAFVTANAHGPLDCALHSLIIALINPAGHNLFTKHLYIIRFTISNMEDKEYYVLWLRLTAYLVTSGKRQYMSGTAEFYLYYSPTEEFNLPVSTVRDVLPSFSNISCFVHL